MGDVGFRSGRSWPLPASAIAAAIALVGCSSSAPRSDALTCRAVRGAHSSTRHLQLRDHAAVAAVTDGYTVTFSIVSLGGPQTGTYRMDVLGPNVPKGRTSAEGDFNTGRPVGGEILVSGKYLKYSCK